MRAFDSPSSCAFDNATAVLGRAGNVAWLWWLVSEPPAVKQTADHPGAWEAEWHDTA